MGYVRNLPAANRLISFGGDLAIIYSWGGKMPIRGILRRAVLVSQVDSRRTDWEDSNGGEAIWRDLGGTVLAEWLGDTDPSEWYDDDEYRMYPQRKEPVFQIFTWIYPKCHPKKKTEVVRIVGRIARSLGCSGDVLIVGGC